MKDQYFPIPFDIGGVPEPLQPLLVAAGASGLDADSARVAIEEHWAAGAERTAEVVLAHGYATLKDACEIMVDQQQKAAEVARAAVAEARRLGVGETHGLAAFERLATQIFDEESQRKKALGGKFDRDPASLDRREAANVAYELCDEGQHERAIPFFTRVIELVGPKRSLHYEMNRASCQLRAGRGAEARPFYERVLAEHLGADHFIVSNAFSGLCRLLDDDEPFALMFERGATWAAKKDERIFPAAHAIQEQFLERALERGLGTVALSLCATIEGRGKRLPKTLKATITEARRRFAE